MAAGKRRPSVVELGDIREILDDDAIDSDLNPKKITEEEVEDDNMEFFEAKAPKPLKPLEPSEDIPLLLQQKSTLTYDMPLILFSREIPAPEMPEHMAVKKRSMSEQIPTNEGMSILTFLKSRAQARKKN